MLVGCHIVSQPSRTPGRFPSSCSWLGFLLSVWSVMLALESHGEKKALQPKTGNPSLVWARPQLSVLSPWWDVAATCRNKAWSPRSSSLPDDLYCGLCLRQKPLVRGSCSNEGFQRFLPLTPPLPRVRIYSKGLQSLFAFLSSKWDLLDPHWSLSLSYRERG